MSKLLVATNLTKSFELDDLSKINIINDISLEIEMPEVLGIMGESGAGKSTLLNIVSTIDEPSSGSVELCGSDISKLNEKELSKFRNEKIGFIYQFHHLLPEFDVLENVLIPNRISGKKLNKLRAKELLEVVGLSDRINYSVKKLSGGEQQRVSIARSLMNSPEIIFCDEPTGNLDHKNTEHLFKLFQSLNKNFGMTFVIVSHSDMLKDYSDRMIYLEDGKIKE
jgi:lipoprotein-releasing system ATP-binding protein